MKWAAVTACVWLVAAASASAHPAPFSYLDLRLTEAGVDGSIVLHDLDVAHDVGVDPPERFADPAFAAQYRDQLSRLMDSRIALFVDGRRTSLTWTGFETLPERQSLRLTFSAGDQRPGRLRVETVVFPYDSIHQTFLNVYEDGGLRHQAILDQQRTAFDYYAGTWQGATAVMGVFIPAGIEHIVIGPDHVLFLIGLLLLGGTLWRLATIVTAFTLGHSITLSLAALDVVSPPAAIVEPVIALSIVFVGADNLLVQRDRAKAEADEQQRPQPRDIRAWVAGVFGLIHGFGFASVLKEFGLPLTALGWSLFSFNLGVEIGQLAIVFVVAAVLASVRRREPQLARRLVIAGSIIVIAAGGYWFVERVFLP
ncbi:MAG TPA: HupE/UreJ family protein [Vicinamibacterales bacterium]|nr:HupE/UreJ family protein [Vicinamibacterales bacterium]